MPVICSHNSMTYLKPRKWWMRLLAFTARCQSKTIEEQYAAGIRQFDIRIRHTNYGTPVFCHGLIEYDYFVYDVFDFLAKNKDCKIRIVHEIPVKQMHDCDGKDIKQFVDTMFKQYGDSIDMTGIICKLDWTIHIKLDSNLRLNDYPCVTKELYSSCWTDVKYYGKHVWHPRWLLSWFPWLYAVLFNKRNLKKYADSENLMIDFV